MARSAVRRGASSSQRGACWPTPSRIIVAVRSNEPSPLADARLPALELTGLDLEASRRCWPASATIRSPAAVPSGCFRATGGNPLALIELAGEAETVAGSLVEAPPADRDDGRARVRGPRLAPFRDGTSLAARDGGSGHDGDLGRHRARRRLRSASTIGALQEAEAAGLVAVSDGRVEFRHPLVRSAVHNAAEPAERRARTPRWRSR